MSTVYDAVQRLKFVRSALYVPASNARALEKALGLDADMLIIDLEDAVAPDAKDAARAAAIAFVQQGAAGKFVAVRVNAPDSGWFDADAKAFKDIKVDALILPKVESLEMVKRVCNNVQTPVIAMIETPEGLYAAREIAGHPRVAGLIAGINDISELCGIQPGPQRQGLELSLQMIVLAAASAIKPAFDGVCNRLDDMSGFESECVQGRTFGFTGKTLIHPNQIAPANMAFSPTQAEVEDAGALLAEAKAGATRFRGRMIEAMHVKQAKLTMERAAYAINGLV